MFTDDRAGYDGAGSLGELLAKAGCSSNICSHLGTVITLGRFEKAFGRAISWQHLDPTFSLMMNGHTRSALELYNEPLQTGCKPLLKIPRSRSFQRRPQKSSHHALLRAETGFCVWFATDGLEQVSARLPSRLGTDSQTSRSGKANHDWGQHVRAQISLLICI